MSVAIVTGSGGLVGSESARHLSALGLHVVGIDNDMRKVFFGPDGSVEGNLRHLSQDLGGSYSYVGLDIRDRFGIDKMFARYGRDVSVVIHTAAQPAHDYADEHPLTDWDINAGGTLNLLEATRWHSPAAVFVYLSTIKVYGPHPNDIPLTEHETRYEADSPGFDETMSIDGGPHSLFGASKTAADVMVQEYGHAYGLHTVILRPGCLTGPAHAAAEAHGMLGYLMRAVTEGRTYRVFGYGGKQVRDQLHANDVTTAIGAVVADPAEPGTVFNLGGGRGTDVSILEALAMAEEIADRPAKVEHLEGRRGDHCWWVTDTAKFRARYPHWQPTADAQAILEEIHAVNAPRWQS